MSTTTFSERLGVEERLLEHLVTNRVALKAKGLDVDYWIAQIKARIAALKAADARQEALKAELKASTVTVNATDREAYVFVSGAIDAAVGAWGKDSEEGVVLARMRSKLHRPDEEPEAEPVEAPSA